MLIKNKIKLKKEIIQNHCILVIISQQKRKVC